MITVVADLTSISLKKTPGLALTLATITWTRPIVAYSESYLIPFLFSCSFAFPASLNKHPNWWRCAWMKRAGS